MDIDSDPGGLRLPAADRGRNLSGSLAGRAACDRRPVAGRLAEVRIWIKILRLANS